MPNRLRAAPGEGTATGSGTAASGRGGNDSRVVCTVADDRRGSALAMVTNGPRKRWATFAKSSAVPNSRGWAASNSAAAAEGSISAATTRCSSTRTAKKCSVTGTVLPWEFRLFYSRKAARLHHWPLITATIVPLLISNPAYYAPSIGRPFSGQASPRHRSISSGIRLCRFPGVSTRLKTQAEEYIHRPESSSGHGRTAVVSDHICWPSPANATVAIIYHGL